MIQDPPATGSAELNSFLVDVKNAINTATKPLAGWKLSDFEAGVSEVISDKRDLIDIVTAWDDLVNIRSNFETEVARYETLYSDSKVLGNQYQEYADTFSQIMEWWDQNVRLIEDIEAFLTEVNADMSAAASSASAAATSEANAKTSETNAGNSASSASSSASAAADSASDAADSASTAASSASAAADSASDAAGAADSAAGSKSQAASSASSAASSASAADSAATRAESVADSTHWQDDRLSVMGQLGPSLKGPKGDPGEKGDGTGDVLWSELNPVLDGKAPAGHQHSWGDVTGKPTAYPPETHTHTAANISDATTVGRNVLKATDAAAARTAIGAGTSNLTLGTTSSTAAAGNHTHTASQISGLQSALDGKAPVAHNHDERYVGTSGNTTKTGDLTFNGGSVNYMRPDTTGGWARGFWWNDLDYTAIAGIGVFGNADVVNYFYLGHGSEAWANPVFRAYEDLVRITNLEVTGDVTGLDNSHTHTTANITDARTWIGRSTDSNSVVRTDQNGWFFVGNSPTNGNHPANKAYVDARTPDVRVVSALPASPTAGVVYLVTE